MGWSGKSAKRKRSRSKSQTPAKRKRSQSKPTKRKRAQTGGIYPPIHYPAGNYPGYNRIMKGGGLFDFSNVLKKFNKERIADCKDWLKRKQKGGRRPAKKPENKREPERNVNPGNKLERKVNPENKREDGELEKSVNPENKRGLVCGQ